MLVILSFWLVGCLISCPFFDASMESPFFDASPFLCWSFPSRILCRDGLVERNWFYPGIFCFLHLC